MLKFHFNNNFKLKKKKKKRSFRSTLFDYFSHGFDTNFNFTWFSTYQWIFRVGAKNKQKSKLKEARYIPVSRHTNFKQVILVRIAGTC